MTPFAGIIRIRSKGCVLSRATLAGTPVTRESNHLMRPLPFLVLLACVSAGAVPGARATGDLAALERDVARLVNEHRTAHRLNALRVDSGLAAIAREHSAAMAAGRVPMGHDGFSARADRVERLLAYHEIAENVAMNDYGAGRTVRVAVDGWLKSPHHLENIEGDFNLTGVGIARSHEGAFYYTQLFVASVPNR